MSNPVIAFEFVGERLALNRDKSTRTTLTSPESELPFYHKQCSTFNIRVHFVAQAIITPQKNFALSGNY